MSSPTTAACLLSLRRSTRWLRSLLALHLLVTGSLLWSPVAAVVHPQINIATKFVSPGPNFDLVSAPDATPAPVQLTLAVAPTQVEPSGVVTYTVVITNTLADRAISGLVVSDTLPPELAYWPAEKGKFSYLGMRIK